MIRKKGFEIWLTGITLLAFGAFVLGLLLAVRKPFCFDSKVVDKISFGSDSVLFRCTLQKGAPLHGYLYERDDLLKSLLRTENFLNVLSPFKSGVSIKIIPEPGLVYKLESRTLTLSRRLAESEGILEKALIKIWLRGLNSAYFENDLLAEEVFSDLILTMIQGQFKIEDPFRITSKIGLFEGKQRLSIKNKKWPTVLKTVSGYCQSEWKIAEHYQMCSQINRNSTTASLELMDLSLRPLLSSLWIGMYGDLSLQEKIEVSRGLTQMITSLKVDIDFHFLSLNSTQEEPLNRFFLNVQKVNSFWTDSFKTLGTKTYRHLMSLLASGLSNRGFKGIIDVIEFDLVYSSDEILDSASPRIQAMADIANRNPELRILLRDPVNVWFLPSKQPISKLILRKVKANKMVLETCSQVQFSRVMSYASETSKLLVIRTCNPKRELIFDKYMASGAEGFAIENQRISFVQFHLPSMLIRKSELDEAGDVFRFVGQRKIDSPSFQSLGWQQIDWSESAQAFRPRGYVDAIELFRVFPQETSISNL